MSIVDRSAPPELQFGKKKREERELYYEAICWREAVAFCGSAAEVVEFDADHKGNCRYFCRNGRGEGSDLSKGREKFGVQFGLS